VEKVDLAPQPLKKKSRRQRAYFEENDFSPFISQPLDCQYSANTLNELDQLVHSEKYYICYSKLSAQSKVFFG
jgi:hypothetical protein